MIYDIRHITTYSYESPVSFARCSLRLQPADNHEQHLVSHSVEIKPVPAERSTRIDFFGIRTENIVIETAHRVLQIDSRSRVAVERETPKADQAFPPWEKVRQDAFDSNDPGATSPVGYLFASPLVPIVAPVTDYAAQSFPPGQNFLTGVSDLMRRINTDFIYDTRATDVSTPLRNAFAKRRGVCQDFAHIMIGGLRGLGLPAGYVSGYLRTNPPPGRPRLQGADATHAWVTIWCGAEAGWIGFDPTNNLIVGDDHVVLASGRDYTDVSPVDGVIVGSRKQRLSVAVDVIPLEQLEAS